jgi:hypothetical protein
MHSSQSLIGKCSESIQCMHGVVFQDFPKVLEELP